MTIIANAFPKCGTNLVKKTLGAMGLVHFDGGLIRHNMAEDMRFVVPVKSEGKTAGMPKSKIEIPVAQVLAKPHDTFIHAHLCHGGGLPLGDAKMIFIHRNPRDALISMLRTNKGGVQENKASLLALINQGMFTYGPWAGAWHRFMRWYAMPWVLTIRFDEIWADDGATVARMAEYLGLEGVDAPRIASGLYGHGKQFEGRDVYEGDSTWSDRKPSSWKNCDYWDDEVEQAWDETGGVETETVHGYGG